MAAACSGGGAAANVPLGEKVSFGGLSYQAPAAWVSEQPSSNMRLAQYKVPGAGAAEAGECALFHFPGTGGPVQANLDRWYGQFQQPDGGSTAQKAKVEKFQVGTLPVTLVEVSGTYVASMGPMDSGGPKPGYRLVAGVMETGQGPWFLKCTGPEATMISAAPAVRALLKTAQP
jgi:hypothetical protein